MSTITIVCKTDVEVNYLLDNLQIFLDLLPSSSSLLVFRQIADTQADVRRLYERLAIDSKRLIGAGIRDLWLVPEGRLLTVTEPSTAVLLVSFFMLTFWRRR